MRYAAPERTEIIQLVEQSLLPVKRTLEKLDIPWATFYGCCDLVASKPWPIARLGQIAFGTEFPMSCASGSRRPPQPS
jgi:hypothetical protein